jgi:hypothetical protein
VVEGAGLESVEEIITRLSGEQARAAAAIESLRLLREQVTAGERQLEGPTAAFEHIDYFQGFFHRGAEEIGRVAASLPAGVRRADVEAIRQLASNSAAEQRRLVQFRDKWVNKPLPYEQMRAVLTGISDVARQQLDAFRALAGTAEVIEAVLLEREQKDGKAFDRRALFNRIFKPPSER